MPDLQQCGEAGGASPYVRAEGEGTPLGPDGALQGLSYAPPCGDVVSYSGGGGERGLVFPYGTNNELMATSHATIRKADERHRLEGAGQDRRAQRTGGNGMGFREKYFEGHRSCRGDSGDLHGDTPYSRLPHEHSRECCGERWKARCLEVAAQQVYDQSSVVVREQILRFLDKGDKMPIVAKCPDCHTDQQVDIDGNFFVHACPNTSLAPNMAGVKRDLLSMVNISGAIRRGWEQEQEQEIERTPESEEYDRKMFRTVFGIPDTPKITMSTYDLVMAKKYLDKS
jgi:hypothetical protein